MRQRIANTQAKTDDDISDEAAGTARSQMALDSKARKDVEAAELREHAKDLQALLRLPFSTLPGHRILPCARSPLTARQMRVCGLVVSGNQR